MTQLFNAERGITTEMLKAHRYYELASYLQAAGKRKESEDAIKTGDEIINLNCPPDKDKCERIKRDIKYDHFR